MAETIVGGHSGLHVPANQPDALAHAIGRILDDDVLAGELSRNGLERAKDFTIDRMLARLIAIYEDAASRRGGSRR
jgi:glycosyltransferase involved in cell wall biosynthesis